LTREFWGLREQGTHRTGNSKILEEKEIFLADKLMTESAFAFTIVFSTSKNIFSRTLETSERL
jgi:hypothetical protein